MRAFVKFLTTITKVPEWRELAINRLSCCSTCSEQKAWAASELRRLYLLERAHADLGNFSDYANYANWRRGELETIKSTMRLKLTGRSNERRKKL